MAHSVKTFQSHIFLVDLSLPDTADQLQGKVAEILTAFQTGALTHCDLDKNYNDKLCLEYELNVSSEYLTTIDEWKFKEESQKFYPRPNEEWEANDSYFPRFEHLQRLTLPSGSYSTKI
ncbi:unnamed protein product [Adineta ricciae]|uniref:Uncharacterized protein n=1 Tax=Adineta ricciae TaxID=249248 RepID=A0A815MDM4_ADIRI|nr:unnamed protein product [Adineta ricciae]